MFWKKKKPHTDEFSSDSTDQRESFRYHFKDGQGFQVEFNGKKVWVLNISAGGISFKNKGFEQFDFDQVKISLDIPDFIGDTTFSAGVRILRVDEQGICHCIFEQCSLEQHELIHKYVLEKQKNDLAH